MRNIVIFIICCICAGIAPFIANKAQNNQSPVTISEWPNEFEGKKLVMLTLTEREKKFEFPGTIGRFTDGTREIIIRKVTTPTRLLHPSSDCFRGLGYKITPQPATVDKGGKQWSSFIASRNDERLKVYERIYSTDGKSWTDVSAWYWSALLNNSTSPWTAITIAEKE